MKRIKFLIIYIIMISMVFTGNVFADTINDSKKDYTKEYIEYLKLSDEEKSKVEVVPRKYFVPFDSLFTQKESNTNIISKAKSISNDVSLPNEELPSRFDLRDKINVIVEDQGESGWCWAYSSLKCLQTNYALSSNQNIDLSESHLAYMRLNQMGGWRTLSLTSNKTLGETNFETGGNFEDFIKYVGLNQNSYGIASTYGIIGPVIQNDNIENRSYEVDDILKSKFSSMQPCLRVTKITQFPDINKTYDSNGKFLYASNGDKKLSTEELNTYRDSVKNQIKNNGAIYTVTNIESPWYNESNNSLYINDNTVKYTHGVAIIGWDDNYKKENFTNIPANDGAYIVLNSWGNEWGDKGVYYVSYDDSLVELWQSGVVSSKLFNSAPIVSIEKSEYSNSDSSVSVYLKSDEELKDLPSGWNLDTSYLDTSACVYKKVYYSNTSEKIPIKAKYGTGSTEVNINITDFNESSSTISLNKTDYVFNEYTPLNLVATITSDNLTQNVTWTSSNKDVAVVKSDGKVFVTGKGKCIITATFVDDDNLKASCNIVSNLSTKQGDINKDGIINTSDAIYGLRKLVMQTLTSEENLIGDVNGTNSFDITDAIKIMRYVVGRIKTLS